MKRLTFEKENDNRWYIVLPEWTGDKGELEMVHGADTMLDILARGESIVHLSITEDKNELESPSFTLQFNRDEAGGGIYDFKSDHHEFEIWLCHVTKFVYDGRLPKTLYCI